jgi:hypothetical protein
MKSPIEVHLELAVEREVYQVVGLPITYFTPGSGIAGVIPSGAGAGAAGADSCGRDGCGSGSRAPAGRCDMRSRRTTAAGFGNRWAPWDWGHRRI